jgi:flagellin
MGLRIRTNATSLNAQRTLGKNNSALQNSMEKLSSGYRINKAADDAAGLAISNNLEAKIRSMGQAKRNANDGISLVQVAEGGMNEMSNILIRMRELATQSASDTISNSEREYTNREYVQLVDEIDRIANVTEFNGVKLLGGEDDKGFDELSIHVGEGDGSAENTDRISLSLEAMKINSEDVLGLGKGDEIGPQEAGDDFSSENAAEKLTVIDDALKTVSSSRATLGSKQSRLNSTINNLSVAIENASTSKSRIKDVDFASETANMTQNRILTQAGVSVLGQASQLPEMALSLL